MTLTDAIATGLKFKRQADLDWYGLKSTGNVFSVDQLKATDWYTEICPLLAGDLNMVKLEAAFTAVGQTPPPDMSRVVFRKFVLALCGMVIK